MPFHSFPTGINDSPMVKSVFVENYSQAGDFPPPPDHKFFITDNGTYLDADNGESFITD